MLKDALKELMEKQAYTCKFNSMLKEIDGESQAVLISLMKNEEVSSRSIHTVLESENIKIGRSSIEDARKCFFKKQTCKCADMQEIINK
jgi:hypothetical protein